MFKVNRKKIKKHKKNGAQSIIEKEILQNGWLIFFLIYFLFACFQVYFLIYCIDAVSKHLFSLIFVVNCHIIITPVHIWYLLFSPFMYSESFSFNWKLLKWFIHTWHVDSRKYSAILAIFVTKIAKLWKKNNKIKKIWILSY